MYGAAEAEALPLEVLLEELEKLLQQTGLLERRKIGEPPAKPALFLSAALPAGEMVQSRGPSPAEKDGGGGSPRVNPY